MPDLTLYHFMDCPYCRRVRDFLNKEKISVPLKDTHENPANRDELIKIGGKPQVPCLVIDGKALYESLDIIEWFKKNYSPRGTGKK
jgi:glutaredoxin